MSAQTVPEAVRRMTRCTELARQACDDILAVSDSMTYADRAWFRDDVTAGRGWSRHFNRVLRQHYDAGWDVRAAFDVWQEYFDTIECYAGLVTEHLGMTPGQGVDPSPRWRILKPGEMTNNQKDGWAVSAGLFVVVTVFAILLTSTDTTSYSGHGGSSNAFGLPIALGYIFWAAMTAWWCFAGEYEKTHPTFAKARVGVGMVGVGLLAKRVNDAHEGVKNRLKDGGCSACRGHRPVRPSRAHQGLPTRRAGS